MKMVVPLSDVSCSNWTPWADRKTLIAEAQGHGGVYLLAYFSTHTMHAPRLESLPPEVIYVGDSKDLRNRPLMGDHHKVKNRFAAVFGAAAEPMLFLSVARLYELSTKLEYANQRTYSLYVENMLAWEYVQQHGHPPVLQVKDRKGNEWVSTVVAALRRGIE